MDNYNSLGAFFNNKIIQLLILLFLSPYLSPLTPFFSWFVGFQMPLVIGFIMIYTIVFSWFSAFICLKYCPLALKLQIFSFLSCSVIIIAIDLFLDPSNNKISRDIYKAIIIVLIIIFLYLVIYILWKRRWSSDIFYFIISAFGTWLIPGVALLMSIRDRHL